METLRVAEGAEVGNRNLAPKYVRSDASASFIGALMYRMQQVLAQKMTRNLKILDATGYLGYSDQQSMSCESVNVVSSESPLG